jgi:hypothetical protein
LAIKESQVNNVGVESLAQNRKKQDSKIKKVNLQDNEVVSDQPMMRRRAVQNPQSLKKQSACKTTRALDKREWHRSVES